MFIVNKHGGLWTHIGVLKAAEIDYRLLQDQAWSAADDSQSMLARAVNVEMRTVDAGIAQTVLIPFGCIFDGRRRFEPDWHAIDGHTILRLSVGRLVTAEGRLLT